jgi:tRNA(Ile)-lysidine synthase
VPTDGFAAGVSPPLAHRFEEQLARSALLRDATAVGVAVSGGLDSQVLLHLLRFGTAARHVDLFALHFDHRMRTGSAADAAWVAGLCAAWEVPLSTARADRPLASETAARAARYAFFDGELDARPGALVATAHHQDDQVETVLYRLLRGSGVSGLRGIPERRGRYRRPLLAFARAELAAYAGATGIRPRHDVTNEELSRARNAIRHLLLPALERARSGARAAVLRLAAAADDAETRFAPLVDEAERLAVSRRDDGAILLATVWFHAYHPEIRTLLLRRLLARLGCVPGRTGTRAAMQFISRGRSGGRLDLPRGVQLESGFDRIVLRRVPPPAAPDEAVVITEAGSGRGTARVGGRSWRVRWSREAAPPDAWTTSIDPAAVRFPLVVRGWRPGDRIRLRYGTKKLKKLFGEMRLDRQARSRTPVLAEGRDRVLWIVGQVRSIDARPGPEPALHITVMDG